MSVIRIPEDMVEGSECLKYGVPWMVPEAIFKLDDILSKNDKVFEFGAGGSTVFFAERCKNVYSVDTDSEWGTVVIDEIKRKDIKHKVELWVFKKEENILTFIHSLESIKPISVLIVDTQGGIDRSAILNSFLNKGISDKLRIIVLDNYSHEGLFPLHHDKILDLGEEWEVFTYDHERWAGSGTRIYVKKEK